MNRQQGNQQRKKKLKDARDKTLSSPVYSKTRFNFPKASKSVIKKYGQEAKKTQKKESLIKYSVISIIIIISFIYLYFTDFF
ncbi:hypothetical protein [Tenacibaculum jejuense]|nr:hypothetical protein [Tenacibaculum jejuense]